MEPLSNPDVDRAVRGMNPTVCSTLFDKLQAEGEFGVAGRRFVRDGGELRALCFFGTRRYLVPVTDLTAIALCAKLASVASMPAGRNARDRFELRLK